VFSCITTNREIFLRNLALTVSFPFLIAALCPPTRAVKVQTSCTEIAKTNASPKIPDREQLMPFRIGETLTYHVTFAGFSNAATVELSVPEHRLILGEKTWHFRASAHTLSPLRSFMTIDDQIDSYTDVGTFESRQYETHLKEMGSIENEILYPSSTGQVHRIGAPEVAVLPGTLDPLGALFLLRTVDWRQISEFRAPIYDGQDLLEVRAREEVHNETVAVDAGNFSATCISIHLYQKGVEVTGESFSLWLASDPSRTPILLQAQMPLGRVRVELASTQR
jgi:hypothetical protein